MRTALPALLACLLLGSGAAAQTVDHGIAPLARPAPAAPQQDPSVGAAFAVEALGGALGSAIGFGTIVALTDEGDCGEDLSCILGNAAAAVVLATVGSAGGTWLAGRWLGSEPSGWGAIVGAVAGAAAAIGVDHLLREEANLNISEPARFVIFSVTQGTVTALGSRIGAALR